jgi:hypothetical protein
MTDQTPDQSRVLDKIRKLLAMGKDERANETERETALRQAHFLLAKHGLEEAEAEAAGGKAAEVRTSLRCESRDQPWCRVVALAIANLMFCGYFYNKRRDGSGKVIHNFVGRVSNAETARQLTDFVISSITSEANKKWKLQPDPGPWWTNFCKGAAAQISTRCLQLRTEAERASEEEAAWSRLEGKLENQLDAPAAGPGTALVLASLYRTETEANDGWIAENIGKLHTPADRQKQVGTGYREGREFGSKVSLNRQVGHTAAKRLGG